MPDRHRREQQQAGGKKSQRRAPIGWQLGVAEADRDEVAAADEHDTGEKREGEPIRPRYLSQSRSPKKKSCPCATVRATPVFTSSTKNPPWPTYAIFVPSGDQAGTTSSPVCPTDLRPVPSHGTTKRSDGTLRCASWPLVLARAIVCPAAENTTTQSFGENLGACRYQKLSLL